MRSLGFFKSWSAWEWVWRFVVEGALGVLVAYLSRRYFEEFFLGMKGRLTPSTQAVKESIRLEPVGD